MERCITVAMALGLRYLASSAEEIAGNGYRTAGRMMPSFDNRTVASSGICPILRRGFYVDPSVSSALYRL